MSTLHRVDGLAAAIVYAMRTAEEERGEEDEPGLYVATCSCGERFEGFDLVAVADQAAAHAGECRGRKPEEP